MIPEACNLQTWMTTKSIILARPLSEFWSVHWEFIPDGLLSLQTPAFSNCAHNFSFQNRNFPISVKVAIISPLTEMQEAVFTSFCRWISHWILCSSILTFTHLSLPFWLIPPKWRSILSFFGGSNAEPENLWFKETFMYKETFNNNFLVDTKPL